MEERFVSQVVLPEDNEQELSLRPKRLSEYIGQVKVKERMKIFCGEDVLDNDKKIAEEFIGFIGAALGRRQ